MELLILVGLCAAVWLLLGLSDHTQRTIDKAGDALDTGAQAPASAIGSMALAVVVFVLGALLVIAFIIGAGVAMHGGSL